jgi:hypothetical protein
LGAGREQRDYVVEQVVRALGEDWARENRALMDAYSQAIGELGYGLPDEPPSGEREAA